MTEQKSQPMLRIPYSRYIEFMKERQCASDSLRLGQAFHTYMELDKIQSDRDFCDLLYNADLSDAKKLLTTWIKRKK